MPITLKQSEIDAYLREHYANGSTKEIAAAIGRTEKQVMARAYELKIKKSKSAKGRRTQRWVVLDEILELIYADMHNSEIMAFLGINRGDLIARACLMGLKKSRAIMSEVVALRNKTLRANSTAQFQPGIVPWNKGMRGFDPVLGRGLYRPGNKSPRSLPVGTLRKRGVTQDSQKARYYLERKVAEPNEWVRVHRLVWEAENGPVPPDHIIVFKTGKHSIVESEITADRLECITRAELASRNHPMNHSPELADIYQLRSAISRQINRITKESDEQPTHQ